MTRLLTGAALAAFLFTAGSTIPSQAQNKGQKDDLLWLAGFTTEAFDTPQFARALKELPPHQFVHHTVDGVTTFYYLDPVVCRCLYVGTQGNWDAYKADTASRLHMDAELSLLKDDYAFDGHG